MEKQIMGMMMVIVMIAVLASVVQAAPPEPTPPPDEPTPPEPPAPGKAALYGVVTDSVTGGAVAGALITLDGAYTAYSNSVGQYEIGDIEPGNYTLKVEKAGYHGMAITGTPLQEGVTRADIALTPIPQKATLYGVVTDQSTAEALEAVKVTLWATFVDPETGVVVPGYTFTAYTDSDGRYEIGDIGPGSCLLTFEKEGYGNRSVDITLPEGITRADVALVPILQKATLYGVVTDQATGGALEGVLVTLDTSYSAYTDSSGLYEIADIEPGSYTLKFEKTGYGTAIVDVILPEGTVRIDASLVKDIVPAAEFYVPAEMWKTILDGTILDMYWSHKSRVDITNKGDVPGTHNIHVWDSIGNIDYTFSLTLQPGQTHRIEHQQWLPWEGYYSVYLEGDWVGNNYSEAIF